MAKHNVPHHGGLSKEERARAKRKGLHAHNGHKIGGSPKIIPDYNTFIHEKRYNVAGRPVAFARRLGDKKDVFVGVERNGGNYVLYTLELSRLDALEGSQGREGWEIRQGMYDCLVQRALPSDSPFYAQAREVARAAGFAL